MIYQLIVRDVGSAPLAFGGAKDTIAIEVETQHFNLFGFGILLEKLNITHLHKVECE